jgi:polysaccharide pyruvyl transferase WcaK-like protein
MEMGVLDVQHAHAVLASMAYPQKAMVLKQEYTARQLLSMIGHFEFALGMRLHFLIFAALQGVPFVPLSYGTKISGFSDEFGMNIPTLDQMNAGQLLSHVDRTWDFRSDFRPRIEGVLHGLQTRARETNRLLLDVIAGIDRSAVRMR